MLSRHGSGKRSRKMQARMCVRLTLQAQPRLSARWFRVRWNRLAMHTQASSDSQCQATGGYMDCGGSYDEYKVNPIPPHLTPPHPIPPHRIPPHPTPSHPAPPHPIPSHPIPPHPTPSHPIHPIPPHPIPSHPIPSHPIPPHPTPSHPTPPCQAAVVQATESENYKSNPNQPGPARNETISLEPFDRVPSRPAPSYPVLSPSRPIHPIPGGRHTGDRRRRNIATLWNAEWPGIPSHLPLMPPPLPPAQGPSPPPLPLPPPADAAESRRRLRVESDGEEQAEEAGME